MTDLIRMSMTTRLVWAADHAAQRITEWKITADNLVARDGLAMYLATYHDITQEEAHCIVDREVKRPKIAPITHDFPTPDGYIRQQAKTEEE